MAKVIAITQERRTPLTSGWRMLLSAPAAFCEPSVLSDNDDWIVAEVPGTAASSLMRAGRWHFDSPEPLEGYDFWYHTQIQSGGFTNILFEGLATFAEVYIDGIRVLTSDNMFLEHEHAICQPGAHHLHLCFRALTPALEEKRKRARWRPRLPSAQNLRFVRTTFLGHMPSWCPPVHAIGPWRDIFQVTRGPVRVRKVELHARLDGTRGILDISLELDGQNDAVATVNCAGQKVALTPEANGQIAARLECDSIEPWWPHTHGSPRLYPVTVCAGDTSIDLGHVGFRRIAVDRDRDGQGFGLTINGVPVFCRGANWIQADIIGLSSTRATYLPGLLLMRDAGMNMVRVPANATYEGDAFYRLCDELGLMVWQDFMFANFDYPANDDAFLASVETEARQFLGRTQVSPSITVLCGGSEIAQQAAMFGLPRETWSNAIFDSLLPKLTAEIRPDAIYVPHTPYGGELPFVPHEGISHYYGVTAYFQPLEDARRANVRFASECLCFANVPDLAPFILESDAPKIEHPIFAPRVPNDKGAAWYFEDVRNFYLEALYGVDAASLRRDDPEHFLDLSRAVTAEVMETTFAEWRRTNSATRGGLVWFYQDLWPGSGWGVVDSLGEPKSSYFGLKRAFKTLSVILTDEGINGLHLHIINETPVEKSVRLSLNCLRDGETAVMHATRDMTLAPRSTIMVTATELWGGFFDTTYAYRFGEPSHDATVAQLYDMESNILAAEAFHFPLGRGHQRHELGLQADLAHTNTGWCLQLEAKKLAQSVHILDDVYRPEDNWFHLAPGHRRQISLIPRFPTKAVPKGNIAAVNGGRIAYGPEL